MSHRVVIALHNAIEAAGLGHIIHDAFGISAHQASSIDELLNLPADAIDLVVTDAQHFVENLKVFLPRKARTMVVVDHPGHGDGDVNLIDIHQDADMLITSLKRFLDEKEENPQPDDVLSGREVDVLRLVASGMINKQIADNLHISINTVLTHRKNITAKLGIKSVSGLSFYAMMNGIIDPK